MVNDEVPIKFSGYVFFPPNTNNVCGICCLAERNLN